MIAAIYARKSTEQHGADADAKSVARQVENARAFAVSKGWTVNGHVFTDDAVSGAETRKLVNRQRLLDELAGGRPPFQVLIMRDASRFSRRDGDEAFGELKRIAQAGVAIWFYSDATPFTFGTFGENVVGFVRAEMNAEYRRQIAKWTREAMVRKFLAGHVCGGSVFGYDNERVDGHVERRINDAEAAVVRRIFDLSASGWGYTRIAKHLNGTGALAPRPHRKRVNGVVHQSPAGWSPSTIYELLHRPLYRGHLVWNQTTKKNAAGQTAVTSRPEAEWLRVDRPELRLVSEATWRTVHTRIERIATQISATGHGYARRGRDIDSKYLLSGFARCATCGGTLSALSRNGGRSRFYAYGCLAHAKRGATVCTNALVKPVTGVDAAVVDALRFTLRPAVMRAFLERVFEAVQPRTVATNVRALTTQLRALDAKIAHLTAAVESGASLAPLVAQLHARHAERETLIAARASAETVRQLQLDRRVIERKVLEKVESWRDRLLSNGREVLREVLEGPLLFTPVGPAYHFDADLRNGTLLTSLIGLPPFAESPRAHQSHQSVSAPA